MIDFKKSLINLHTKYPEKDLDVLLEILDCIVEIPDFTINSYPEITSIPNNPIYPGVQDRIRYLAETKNTL